VRLVAAALAVVACTHARAPSSSPGLANRAAAPEEVHVVMAPARGVTGELDEPIGWRLERSSDRASLVITRRDHEERRYAGTVHEHGVQLRYELASGKERIVLACERGPVRVHPAGARLLARTPPAHCDEPPPWEPRDELTVIALSCRFEAGGSAQGHPRLLTFAPLPGFDAIEDQCCVGDSCEVRWDVRMR
jgi:hypothetical protein